MKSPLAPPALERKIESNSNGRYTQLVGEYIAADIRKHDRKRRKEMRILKEQSLLDQRWFNLAIFKPDIDLVAGTTTEEREELRKAEI